MAQTNGAAPVRAINKANRSIAIPEAGKDAWIRFRYTDLTIIEAELGDDWMVEVEQRMGRQDLKVALRLWDIGRKGRDGKTPIEVDFDDIDLPVKTTMGLLRDGVFLAMIGMTYEQAVEDAVKRVAEAEQKLREAQAAGEEPEDEEKDEDEDPLKPAPSLSASSDGLTGAA